MFRFVEANYPRSFRAEATQALVQHLKNHDSVVLVGIKRVGISNFLRYLTHHADALPKTLGSASLLLIKVDLHDLIERTVPAFWMLLLKRLVDTVEKSTVSEQLQSMAHQKFLESIQLGDAFFTYDSIQKILHALSEEGFYSVVVLARFDRLVDSFTEDFFHNLQGIRDAAGHLSYIFTSYRPLEQLAPQVFSKVSLSVFAHTQYLPPLTEVESGIILESLCERYQVSLTAEERTELIRLAGGHIQFLHLGVLYVLRSRQKIEASQLLEHFLSDESFRLQSEELLSSLTPEELHELESFASKKTHQVPEYLSASGFLTKENKLFSPLLAGFLLSQPRENASTELSRQEQRLFDVLHANLNNVVERYTICEHVWPDQVELGISDWAIDRLVARLRAKLKQRSEPFKIQTVVSRGYKLVAQ